MAVGLIVILMAYIAMRPVGGSAGRADRGDRERSLDWDQRVRKRPGASYMRFSVTAPRVSGVAKRSRRVQEIVMLTLIEETPS